MSKPHPTGATLTHFQGYAEVAIPQRPKPPMIVRQGDDDTIFIGTRSGARWTRDQVEVLIQVLDHWLRTSRVELDLPVDEREFDLD